MILLALGETILTIIIFIIIYKKRVKIEEHSCIVKDILENSIDIEIEDTASNKIVYYSSKNPKLLFIKENQNQQYQLNDRFTLKISEHYFNSYYYSLIKLISISTFSYFFILAITLAIYVLSTSHY